MPIDVATTLGFETESLAFPYTEDDIILYNLGIGFGSEATNPEHLKFVYENGLTVFPTYGVIPSFTANMAAFGAPGASINPMMALHGEQFTEVLHYPIPTATTLDNVGKVIGVYDKGKGALIDIEVISTDRKTGIDVFRNVFSIFARGEGGFGGDSGNKEVITPPDREPDAVVATPTLPQQALLYRLSGDKNPLHADPQFAAMGGFDRPILHGLSTFGICVRAVYDTYCDRNVSAIRSMQVRFAKHVMPGDTVVTRMWKDGSRVILAANVEGQGHDVITNAVVELQEPTVK